MDESSQKEFPAKSPPSQETQGLKENRPGSENLSNNNTSVFWLRFTIAGIIALNLLFAFYALKSDRFVTPTRNPESENIDNYISSPSQNHTNQPETSTDSESPTKE